MSQFRNQLLPFLETARPTYLEYIKADGSQYFTIPLRTSGVTTYKFSITMTIDSVSSQQDTFLAMWGNQFYTAGTSGCLLRVWNTQGSTDGFAKNFGEKFTLIGSVSSSAATVTVDGTTRTCNGIMTMNSGVYLLNWAGSQYPVNGKIYSCQFYEDNVMVHNFRPCLSGENGEPCLWDTVTQKYYYNAGTGKFKYEKTFLELDYIESDGKQYIETGIYGNANTVCHAKLYTEETVNKNWFGGSRESNGGYVFNAMGPDIIEYYYGNSGWKTAQTPQVVGQIFDIDFNKNSKIYINEIQVADLSEWTKTNDTLTITLFVRSGGSGNIAGRIYTFSIYTASILVRDYIPVYRFDGTICLYDFIDGSYFTNQGTGYFKGQFTDRGKVYEILPYIQPSGLAYINTGVYMRGDYRIKTNATTIIPTGNQCWFGGDNGGNYTAGELAMFYNNSPGRMWEFVGPTSNSQSNVAMRIESSPQDNTYYSFEIYDGALKKMNSTDYNVSYYKDYVCDRSTYIFGTNRGSTSHVGNAQLKLHYWRVQYRDTGTIQELVPVRSNGLVGCFDTVSHTILTNANSTGDFVYPLPAGYTRVQYIESTSANCYINTNIKGVGNGTDIECRYQLSEHTTWHAVYGTRNSLATSGRGWNSFTLRTATSPMYSVMYDTYTDFDGNVDLNIHTIRQESNNFYIDNQLLLSKDVSTFTCDVDNLLLFARDSGGNHPEIFMKGKMWYFKCWINGTCVLDCIPCKNSSSVAGFYDTVQNRFLPSIGSGQFTAGPVIS